MDPLFLDIIPFPDWCLLHKKCCGMEATQRTQLHPSIIPFRRPSHYTNFNGHVSSHSKVFVTDLLVCYVEPWFQCDYRLCLQMYYSTKIRNIHIFNINMEQPVLYTHTI